MSESTSGREPTEDPRGPERPDGERVDRARRLLLRGAVYAAPAVLGLVDVAVAKAQTASCPPRTCPPQSCGPVACKPLGGGCGPDYCKPR